MLIYLAGKYSGNVEENIANARKIAIELWEAGYYVICPHLNTARFETDCRCTYENYMRGDMEMLARCDAVVMLPEWEGSMGAVRERGRANDCGIPVFEYPELPER
jgi:nucleoside 2-deoxyribosyltransferase